MYILRGEGQIFFLKCHLKISAKSVHRKCPQKVSTKSVHKMCPQKVSTKLSTKRVCKKCPQKVSTKGVHKNLRLNWPMGRFSENTIGILFIPQYPCFNIVAEPPDGPCCGWSVLPLQRLPHHSPL